MKLRVWLASATVIILILLLALTVNHAREKDMVELFGRQQLAHVQNTATRMTDIFLQVGKNVALFSRFDPQIKIPSEEIEGDYKIFSSGWEKTLNTVVLFDANEKIKRIFPHDNFPAINLSDHFKALKKKQKQYLGLALTEKSYAGSLKQKTDWYLVVGCPLRSREGKFAGAWMVSFSLAAVLEKYEKQTKDNDLGALWLIDEKQQIIIHPDSAFIGKNIKDLLNNGKADQIDLLKDQGGYFEAVVRLSEKKQQRSVVAFSPLQAGDKRWIIFVVVPYSQVISPVRKTFVYTLFSSLLLILVVVVVGISFAYKEGKRLRVREEHKKIKEREAWQEKLLREKKTIDGIIEGSPIPTFVINSEHKVILWNRACMELTGFSAEEMVGTDKHYMPFYSIKRPIVADLIVDNDVDGLSKHYGTKKVKKSDKVLGAYEAYDYFENLGGRNRHLYFLAAPIYDAEGNIIASIETLQDMSREEELARSLREYAETLQNELAENIDLRREIEDLYNYMQTIVKNLPDKIYELDENGIINYMSRSFKKDGRVHSPEIKGKHFLQFVAPEDRDFVLSKWEDGKKGIHKSYEIEAAAKDGRKLNLLITTSPIIGTNHYIVVQRDITEFKNLEKKLYESQKLSALGQLSAGIAHEVRNPLSSIKMSLQILGKRMNPTGNDLKRFKIAEKEVEHLEELVNNILVFAKPMEPKMVPTDLGKVLELALAMAEKGIADKRVEVRMQLEGIPPVTIDSGMIGDAFLNILRNAVEAVEEHGQVTISAHNLSGDNPAVLVQFEDNGCGIAEEDMPHLFNPFFTRKKYGTGLGLSQVKKIIDVHKGTIDISSVKGKGTIISVKLPFDEMRSHPR